MLGQLAGDVRRALRPLPQILRLLAEDLADRHGRVDDKNAHSRAATWTSTSELHWVLSVEVANGTFFHRVNARNEPVTDKWLILEQHIVIEPQCRSA